MIAIPLVALLLIGAPQDAPASASTPTPPEAVKTAPRFTPEQEEQIKQKQEQIRLSREPQRKEKEAVRLNELAGNIHSEADARALVDAIAEQLTHHEYLLWAAHSIRRRVAHAEYEAVSDPSHLISEDRLVSLWNEYARELGAPQEALITVAEFHNMRGAQYIGAIRIGQKQGPQSIWTMPNIFALNSEGQLAEGCRALEAIKLLYLIDQSFANVIFARERIEKGIPLPAITKQPVSSQPPRQARLTTADLGTTASFRDPIRPAAYRYQQDRGQHEYDKLVRRLFEELLPPGQ
jgi:hypothetical protein